MDYYKEKLPEQIGDALDYLAAGNKEFRVLLEIIYRIDPKKCVSENGLLRADAMFHATEPLIHLRVHTNDICGCGEDFWDSTFGIKVRRNTTKYLEYLSKPELRRASKIG